MRDQDNEKTRQEEDKDRRQEEDQDKPNMELTWAYLQPDLAKLGRNLGPTCNQLGIYFGLSRADVIKRKSSPG